MDHLELRLLSDGLASAPDIERANRLAEGLGLRLPAALVRMGVVAEADLAPVLAELSATELLAREAMTAFASAELNPRFLARTGVLPIAADDDQIVLAMADPLDDGAAGAIAFALGRPIDKRGTATFSDIREAIGMDADRDEPIADGSLSLDELERMNEADSEAPVIRLVHRLLTNAVDRRASDIHIEPMARRVAVRYRIDGRLVELDDLPLSLAAPVASRIKVIATLDIAETRLPQDGRLRITVRGRDVDVRVATSPIAHGESIVMRILGRSEVPLELDLLGIPERSLARLTAALARPHGIILVTGPTGSGKTTTLYAAINRLRRPDVKILTVEDPVEVLLDGINQVQVRPEIELSYAATLRAFLRQDPDILMIGEIRDGETAEIAMRAALTGHLVLSTLHTNSALGSFTRLGDIGVEPYLAASTVIAAVAQRLVRTLCEACSTSRVPDASEAALFTAAALPCPDTLHEPGGCPRCTGTGYRGRAPLIEVVEIDEPLREAIRTGTTANITLDSAETLLAHGLALVAAGRTSLAEVRRVVTAV